jgi:hypothetical protein
MKKGKQIIATMVAMLITMMSIAMPEAVFATNVEASVEATDISSTNPATGRLSDKLQAAIEAGGNLFDVTMKYKSIDYTDDTIDEKEAEYKQEICDSIGIYINEAQWDGDRFFCTLSLDQIKTAANSDWIDGEISLAEEFDSSQSDEENTNPFAVKLSDKLQAAIAEGGDSFDVTMMVKSIDYTEIIDEVIEKGAAYKNTLDPEDYTADEINQMVGAYKSSLNNELINIALEEYYQEICDSLGITTDEARWVGQYRLFATLTPEQIEIALSSDWISRGISLAEEFVSASDLGLVTTAPEETGTTTTTTTTNSSTSEINFDAESVQVKDGDWIDHEPAVYTQAENLPSDDEFAKYDEAFFDEYSLIYLHLGETSGSIEETIKSITVDEDGVWHITVNSYIPDNGTADMAAWKHYITVPNTLNDETEIVVDRIKIYEKSSQGVSEGDANQDGEINADDAYQVLCYYATLSVGDSYSFSDDPDTQAAILEALDINGDGIINTDDAYLILLYYAQQAVGGNPSWDDLV